MEGEERTDEVSVGSVTRSMFSVAMLGGTSYAVVGTYVNRKAVWDRFTPAMRKILQKRFPWEYRAIGKAGDYKGIYDIPQSVMDIAAKYQMPSRIQSRIMINTRIMEEVRDLEEYLEIGTGGEAYLEQARMDTFRSKEVTSVTMNEDPAWAYTGIANKYQRSLRKYKAMFDAADPRVMVEASQIYPTLSGYPGVEGQAAVLTRTQREYIKQLHRKALKESAVHHAPVTFDFGQIRYQPMTPGPGWGIRKAGKVSLHKLLAGAKQAGALSWEDRMLYGSMPEYMGLNIASTEAALTSVYKKLQGELGRVAHLHRVGGSVTPIEQLYTIEPQLINYGKGNVAVRFFLSLRKELDNTVINEEVVVPLGNKGTIRFTRGDIDYVGPLRRSRGELLTPASQYAHLVESHAKNIVNDMSAGRPGQSGWRNTINAMMRRRVTQSQGKLYDIGVRLTVEDEDIMRLHPAYRWGEGERKMMEREVRQLRARLKVLRHGMPDSYEARRVTERIGLLNTQLGGTTTEQLLQFNKAMHRMITEEGEHIPYFWEKTATDAGAFRYISIFGESPFSLEANPQGSIYQYFNTYELTPEIRTSYPLRYGKGTIIHKYAAPNFMPARVVFAGDLYPLSESEVWATEGFYNKITRGKALGTGEKLNLKIPMRGNKLSVDSTQPDLIRLLRELEMYSSKVGGTINPDDIDQIIRNNPTVLRANTTITTSEQGVKITPGRFPTQVVGASKEGGNLILHLERVDHSSTRLRSIIGQARGGMKQMDINMRTTSLSANRPLDFIVSGSIGKRTTMKMIEIGVMADAVESVRVRNDALRKIIANARTPIVRRLAADRELSSNMQRLKDAAGIMGGRYDTLMDAIRMPGVRDKGYRPLRPEQVDQVLIKLGRVYKESDPTFRRIRKIWDTEGSRWAKELNMPKNYLERFTPRRGGPAWWGIVETPDVSFLSPVALDMAGLMRQSHAEMIKTHGLRTGLDAGIPFRYSELQFLMDRVRGTPQHVREMMLEPMERYVSYLAGQMGGEEAAREYNEILRQATSLGPPTGARMIGLGTERSKQFFRDLGTTIKGIGRPRRAATTLYVIGEERVFGSNALARVRQAYARGETVREIPGYQIMAEELGILDPKKGYLGSWIEMPWEMDINVGGASARTKFVKLGAPYGMKVQPVPVAGPGGEYYIVPQYYRRMAEVFEPARWSLMTPMAKNVGRDASRAKLAGENLSRTIESAMVEYLQGKRGALRLDAMTAWESGIQGITMSMPRKLNYGKWKVDFSKYGPTDVVVAPHHAQGLRDLIRQNIYEKYVDPATGMINRVAADAEYKDIMAGRTWFPTMGSRFPITGPMARMPGRLWFEPRLNKMGDFRDYIYIGDLMQRATWGDFDFDIYMFSLAKHWRGSKAVEDLVTTGADRMTDPKIWEGTPAFFFAMGTETYGRGDLMEAYSTELKGVRGGDISGIRVPKAFKLRPADGGLGYNILTYRPEKDPTTGRMYVTKEMDIFTNPTTGKPIVWTPGEWSLMMEAAVKEGRQLKASEIAIMDKLDPKVRAKLLGQGTHLRNALKMAHINADRYMGLAAQKGFIGHATSYAMAMGILAGENLPTREAAAVRTSLAQWIQNVLKAKKWTAGRIDAELQRYGTFTRAIQGVETIDDVFGGILTGATAEGGWELPTDVVQSIISIPKASRAARFPMAGISYDLLHRAVERGGIERTLKGMAEAIGVAGETTAGDILTHSGLKEVLEKMAFRPAGAAPMGGRYGYFARKPLLGPILRGRSKTENTMLADAMGGAGAKDVKNALIGAGVVGALYLAFNFFRPGQMGALGGMPDRR